MSPAKTIPSATLAALVAVALTGCFGSAAPSAAPAPTPTPSMAQPIPSGDGTLTIGALLPFSGANAGTGASALAGVYLAVRDVDEAGGVNGAPVIVLRADAGDVTSTRGVDSLAGLAGRGVDAVVGPNAGDLAPAVSDAAAAAGLPIVTAVADPLGVDEAFTARLRSADPTLADTRFGVETYDATVLIALAAELAGDDGSASIARFLPAVTSGTVECGSYGACLDVLQSRSDIRYTGITGQLSSGAGATASGALALLGFTG